MLGKLFWKARAKAKVVLKEQLAEFCEKRAAGLGGIFGPPDQELKMCIDNRNRELQVIDDLLHHFWRVLRKGPSWPPLPADLRRQPPPSAAAEATVLLKIFGRK